MSDYAPPRSDDGRYKWWAGFVAGVIVGRLGLYFLFDYGRTDWCLEAVNIARAQLDERGVVRATENFTKAAESCAWQHAEPDPRDSGDY